MSHRSSNSFVAAKVVAVIVGVLSIGHGALGDKQLTIRAFQQTDIYGTNLRIPGWQNPSFMQPVGRDFQRVQPWSDPGACRVAFDFKYGEVGTNQELSARFEKEALEPLRPSDYLHAVNVMSRSVNSRAAAFHLINEEFSRAILSSRNVENQSAAVHSEVERQPAWIGSPLEDPFRQEWGPPVGDLAGPVGLNATSFLLSSQEGATAGEGKDALQRAEAQLAHELEVVFSSNYFRFAASTEAQHQGDAQGTGINSPSQTHLGTRSLRILGTGAGETTDHAETMVRLMQCLVSQGHDALAEEIMLLGGQVTDPYPPTGLGKEELPRLTPINE
ncbi:MAG: hypothetical protein U1D30_12255 [Planctomycetota bacterium]